MLNKGYCNEGSHSLKHQESFSCGSDCVEFGEWTIPPFLFFGDPVPNAAWSGLKGTPEGHKDGYTAESRQQRPTISNLNKGVWLNFPHLPLKSAHFRSQQTPYALSGANIPIFSWCTHQGDMGLRASCQILIFFSWPFAVYFRDHTGKSSRLNIWWEEKKGVDILWKEEKNPQDKSFPWFSFATNALMESIKSIGTHTNGGGKSSSQGGGKSNLPFTGQVEANLGDMTVSTLGILTGHRYPWFLHECLPQLFKRIAYVFLLHNLLVSPAT